MSTYEWILCPVCGNKTRVKIRDDTVLENFPLFCPKCKQETIIDDLDADPHPQHMLGRIMALLMFSSTGLAPISQAI